MLLSLLVPLIVLLRRLLLLLLLLLLHGGRVSYCWLKLTRLCRGSVGLCCLGSALTLIYGSKRLSSFLPFWVFMNLPVSSSTIGPVICSVSLGRVGRHFATDDSWRQRANAKLAV